MIDKPNRRGLCPSILRLLAICTVLTLCATTCFIVCFLPKFGSPDVSPFDPSNAWFLWYNHLFFLFILVLDAWTTLGSELDEDFSWIPLIPQLVLPQLVLWAYATIANQFPLWVLPVVVLTPSNTP